MYRVTAIADEFNSYLLEDGENSVRVLAKRGGMPISFVYGGKEIFYSDMETVADWSREVRGGIPILFPACGRLKEGPYGSVKKHGFARESNWTCDAMETKDSASLTLSIRETEETLKTYPHRFSLQHTYILRGNTFTVRQTVTNTDGCTLPFSLGLHPYFNIDPSVATATVPATQYEGPEGFGEFDGSFSFCNDYDSVCHPLSGRESVLETGLGYRIRVIASERYEYFVVWSPSGAQFACVEPWTAPPNALNTGVDLITLAPGESASVEMQIVVE